MLAKYLNLILSVFTTNEYTLKNYFDLAEEVVNYNQIITFKQLVLFVKSLFTNITLEGNVKNCQQHFSSSFYSGQLSSKN